MKTFLVGLAFGVVGGVLLAPKRGQLLRADLRDRAQRAIDAASEAIASRTRTGKSPTPDNRSSQPASAAKRSDDTEGAAQILNTATRDTLIAVHGIGQVLADRIIENRPFRKAYEVVEKGILPESTFIQLRRELLDKSA